MQLCFAMAATLQCIKVNFRGAFDCHTLISLVLQLDCYGVPYIPEGQWLCRKCTVAPETPVVSVTSVPFPRFWLTLSLVMYTVSERGRGVQADDRSQMGTLTMCNMGTRSYRRESSIYGTNRQHKKDTQESMEIGWSMHSLQVYSNWALNCQNSINQLGMLFVPPPHGCMHPM